MKHACVLVVAAGASRRFGSEKIWKAIRGRPLLEWTLDPFLACPRVAEIILVTRSEQIQRCMKYLTFPKVSGIVAGGERRSQSVKNGLTAARNSRQSFLLVHDGARPCLSQELLEQVLDALEEYPVVIPALPVQETVKRCNREGQVLETLDRHDLWLVQTPQGFHHQVLVDSFERGDDFFDAPDDAFLAEQAGYPVHVVEGARENLKVTEPIDLRWVRAILRSRKR